jgi:hypothetical protein
MARQLDVTSIDGIVTALYEIVSGPAGERDWEAERALFLPGARVIPARSTVPGIAPSASTDIEGYIASRGPWFRENDIWEDEVAREVFEFGTFAHVLSSYEAYRVPGGEIILRGINSIQMSHDGERWWVVSLIWDNERPGITLPERFRH